MIPQSYFSPSSLANVEFKWANEVKHYCKNVPIILVGNKVDIRSDPNILQELKNENIVRFDYQYVYRTRAIKERSLIIVAPLKLQKIMCLNHIQMLMCTKSDKTCQSC